MAKLKLSICMMVKNEEENLKKYLPSLRPLFEHQDVELIIVDTGSKDKTKEVATQFTKLIFEKPWNNDFSAMRNYTISKAKGEWIFIIDADEELKGAKGLFEFLQSSLSSKYNTVQIGVRNFSYKDKNLYSTMVSTRLFRNDGEFKYVGSVHNQPKFKHPIVNLTDVYLNHYGYVKDDEALMEMKFKRTSQMLKQELERDPNNVYYRFQLAQSYGLYGEIENASEQIELAYSLLKDKKEKLAKLYIYGTYAGIAYSLKDYQKTMDICQEGLDISNEYIDLYYYVANSMNELGLEKEAILHFQKYFDLLDRVEDIGIGKSSAMEFHKVDEGSITVAAYKLVNLLLKDDTQLNRARQYIGLIKDGYFKNEQLMKYNMETKNFQEINHSLQKMEDKKMRDVMINTIENYKGKLPTDELDNLYIELSVGDEIYHILNKIRISKNIDDQILNIKMFFSKYNIRNTPILYLEEVFQLMIKLNLSIIEFGSKLSDDTLFYLFSKVINKENSSILQKQIEAIEIKEYDFQSNRVLSIITNRYLNYSIQSMLNKDIEVDQYKSLFSKYMKSSTTYILSLYQEKRLRIIYKTLAMKEHVFIINLYLGNQLNEIGNKKGALNYYKDAIEVYPDFRKFVYEFFIRDIKE